MQEFTLLDRTRDPVPIDAVEELLLCNQKESLELDCSCPSMVL